jgi:predicted nuclease of restriction endonuclease-like (RecB) superfamily
VTKSSEQPKAGLAKSKARDFYAEICRIEFGDVRALRQNIGGALFERTLLNPTKLSTALRDMQSQAEQHFHDEAELQLAAIHKEYLSVRREVARRAQCCDGKQIRVTMSRVLTADFGWHFKPNLCAPLEEAPT